MKKGLIISIIFIVALLFFVLPYSWKTLNKAVSLDEEAKAAWSQVENNYERRYDLIPNLVATVKGYASHEEKVLTEVTEKRASVGQIKLSMDDLNNPAKMEAFQKAQSELSGALSRLMVVAEKYPELKANEHFMNLQSQLEGTENRIAVARKDYIEKVRDYNKYLRTIPAKWILSAFGDFEKKEEYKIEEAKKVVPQVKFD